MARAGRGHVSSMGAREFDVIIFGATGYTGEHTARALAKMAAPNCAWSGVKWAIAGRSLPRLAKMCEKHGITPHGVIVANITEEASLIAMCARGAVVMNATGPYRFYGEGVVKAAIQTRTDYVDLCGEPEFIDRCLLKHSEAARAAGVVIVHACAFDSVPADIGCLFTALQFPQPALCAHVDMYHTISVGGYPSGAYAHATTYYAAVHGFGDAKRTRAQRRELLDKLESDKPGSSKGPPPLGPRLRVKPGPVYNKALGRYTFLFPGADVAVVRTSQRAIDQLPKKAGEPYLTPQFGASFAIKNQMSTCLVILGGLAFNILSGYAWGRKLLLAYPQTFTMGAFSEAGPTEEMLAAVTWKSVFFGKGWSEGSVSDNAIQVPASGFDRAVTCSVGGPEPGYISTALMYVTMARFVKEEKGKLGVAGGVFTPGGLVGAGGAPAVNKLITALKAVGIKFEIDSPLVAVTPKPIVDDAKRPAWQTALNAIALLGWCNVLASLLVTWPTATLSWGSPLLNTTLILEGICAFEVVQIAMGMAKGNLPLGVVLHYTRLLIALVVMPLVPATLAAKLVILAWAVTEVARYPMFLLPTSAVARTLRYVTPVATFPLGAGAEAMCAYLSLNLLAASGASSMLYYMVACVVPMNLLGGLAAYGGLVKKAMASLKPAAKPGNAAKGGKQF